MSQHRIGPEERLRVTLLFSAILHAIVILGVTFETVSRVITEFIRLGILQKVYGGREHSYFRGDIAALEKIAEGG